MRRLGTAGLALAGAAIAACHPSRVTGDGPAASGGTASAFAASSVFTASSPSASTPGSRLAAAGSAPASTMTGRPSETSGDGSEVSGTRTDAFGSGSASASPSALIASASPSALIASASGAIGASDVQPPGPLPSLSDPFGARSAFAPYACPNLHRSGALRPYLAAADTSVAFVDGNDWLALVNRSPTGALAPDYAPADLVDLKDLRPRTAPECGAQRECLRHDAAVGLRAMLEGMHRDGLEGVVQSAFRAFSTQCWVFESWAHQARGGFCEAAEQSALPGHSQHQLGTTLDLFTKTWAVEGARTGQGVFRDGYGCSQGGRWLDERAWQFGFVVPYSIHPDDRLNGSRCLARTDRPVPIDPKTGYKSEPWHVRFVGVDAAARYHAAWLASGPGTPDEITLEQWIRAQRGLRGDTEVPVCDGCQCGACATLAGSDTRAPCGNASLWLDAAGRVVSLAEAPRLVDARVVASSARPGAGRSPRSARHRETEPAPAGAKLVVIEASVTAPAHTPTQPPVLGLEGPTYTVDATYLALVPYDRTEPHRYPDLPGAWRIGVEAVPPTEATATSSTADRSGAVRQAIRWPWRASLASTGLEQTWNRANVVLPATAGAVKIRIPLVVPEETRSLAVTLLLDGAEHDTREVGLP